MGSLGASVDDWVEALVRKEAHKARMPVSNYVQQALIAFLARDERVARIIAAEKEKERIIHESGQS